MASNVLSQELLLGLRVCKADFVMPSQSPCAAIMASNVQSQELLLPERFSKAGSMLPQLSCWQAGKLIVGQSDIGCAMRADLCDLVSTLLSGHSLMRLSSYVVPHESGAELHGSEFRPPLCTLHHDSFCC